MERSTVTSNKAGVWVGDTATLTLQAKDSLGLNLVTGGLTVAFGHSGGTSDVSFAAVSDVGDGTYTCVVTGTTAGTTTTFSATIGGQAVTSVMPTLMVALEADLIHHDFEDGTIGDFVTTYSPTYLDFPADPTTRASGKVARVQYPLAGSGSLERGFKYVSASPVGYGENIWFRGKLYCPSGSGDWDGTDNRKLIDWFGTLAVGGIRMTLHRNGADRDLRFSYVDSRTGSDVEYIAVDTGINLADDTWHTIEVHMLTNSADGVADGELYVYMNGSETPDYSRTSGLRWIQEGPTKTTRFQNFWTGYQLTINAGAPGYTDLRYWDDVAFSTTRIGP